MITTAPSYPHAPYLAEQHGNVSGTFLHNRKGMLSLTCDSGGSKYFEDPSLTNRSPHFHSHTISAPPRRIVRSHSPLHREVTIVKTRVETASCNAALLRSFFVMWLCAALAKSTFLTDTDRHPGYPVMVKVPSARSCTRSLIASSTIKLPIGRTATKVQVLTSL